MHASIRSNALGQNRRQFLQKAKRFLAVPNNGRSLQPALPRPPTDYPCQGSVAFNDIEGEWLSSLIPWASGIVQLAGVERAECLSVVEHAFFLAGAHWDTFQHSGSPNERVARVRWFLALLFQAARSALATERQIDRDTQSLWSFHDLIVRTRHGTVRREPNAIDRFEQSTTPERWRVWLLHHVDAVDIEDVAELEGQSTSTIQQWLAAARTDFGAEAKRQTAFRNDPPNGAAMKRPFGGWFEVRR